LAASVARRTPKRLRALLAGNFASNPAPPDETVQARSQASPAADDGPPPAGTGAGARPFLEISVGSRVFSRSMSFAQNVSGLPGYQLAHGTAVTAEMALHPFAASDATAASWAAGIGFFGTVNLAIGLDTQDASGASTRTEAYGYEAGMRYRIIAGAFELLPRVSYLVDNFTVTGDPSPSVHYQVLRAGVGARAEWSSRLSLRASLDYLDVLSAGALTSTTFPRASVNGVDLAIGAGYGIGRTFELQISAAFRRYGFDMRSQAGDAFVAGGASDQYLSMAFGIAYRPSLERH
jgi:hypothetical protein